MLACGVKTGRICTHTRVLIDIDNQVRVWDVQPNTGQTLPKASQSMAQPILCGAWSNDGAAFFCGGADRTAKRWDLGASFNRPLVIECGLQCHWT